MTIRDRMMDWSHMGQDEGPTGLGLVTDESVLMQEHIELPLFWNPESDIGKAMPQTFDALLNDAVVDELADKEKYEQWARYALRNGRPDIALALRTISREEHNHEEILESLLGNRLKPHQEHGGIHQD